MVLVRVPRAVAELAEAIPQHGHKSGPRFDESSCGQAGLSKQRHAITLADGRRLATDVQGVQDPAGSQQRHRHLALSAHRLDLQAGVQVASLPFKLLEQRTPQAQPLNRQVAGQPCRRRHPEPSLGGRSPVGISVSLRLSHCALGSHVQTRTIEIGPDRIVPVVEEPREDARVDQRIVGLRIHQPRQADVAGHASCGNSSLGFIEVLHHRADVGPVLRVPGLCLQGWSVAGNSRHGVGHPVKWILVSQ